MLLIERQSSCHHVQKKYKRLVRQVYERMIFSIKMIRQGHQALPVPVGSSVFVIAAHILKEKPARATSIFQTIKQQIQCVLGN